MTAPFAPLKLCARDADDLKVIASCLQDAIVPIGDIGFLPGEKRFALVASRFRWEHAVGSGGESATESVADPDQDASLAEPPARYERVLCGLCVDGIEAARFRQLDLRDRTQMLSLLTIAGGPGRVELTFAGGAAIQLLGEDWTCRIQDLGEPWPTRACPVHDLDGP